MATIQKDRILESRGQDLYDADGDKIGSVEEIYLDAETNEPEWALVNTGLFGTKRNFVPLRDASESDGSLRVRFAKDQVKDAPTVDASGQLTQSEEAELYAHYGLEYSEARSDSGLPEGSAGSGVGRDTDRGADTTARFERDTDTAREDAGWDDRDRDAGTVGRDVSGPETDDAMTRSEEEMAVGTQRRETGRARLRKYVVTEEVHQTVPVQREEVRIEREPITDANVDEATSGADISEEEHEVVLHAEEPVVEKRVVPQERVRLDKDGGDRGAYGHRRGPQGADRRRRRRSRRPLTRRLSRSSIGRAGRCAGPFACPTRAVGYLALMRAMFVVYLFVIVAGLTYFTVIGLTHH